MPDLLEGHGSTSAILPKAMGKWERGDIVGSQFYQIVCAIYDVNVEEAIKWLKEDLIGFEFEETGDVITRIDHFQILTFSSSPYCHCVATCTVER